MNRKSKTLRIAFGAILVGLALSRLSLAQEGEASKKRPDIRKLSQHFVDAKSSEPWHFEPKSNIEEVSLSEHRGLVTIRESGKGQDIKGLLKSPIRLDEYPAPWEFHLGILQNHLGQKGLSEKQINYAIGLNLAVTFSDPKTWPKDRSKPPSDLKSLQLFVVHLGSIGENYRLGIPAVRRTPLNMGDHSPEVYMFYGRGDLAPSVNGNWKFGYSWVGPDPNEAGTWSKRGGPADTMIRFRVSLLSPMSLQIGAGYGNHPGDTDHLRIGFRSGVKAPWQFSSTFDAGKAFGGIARFSCPCLVSFTGRGVGYKGWGSGNWPNFQKFQIDYVRFRYGLTK